MKKSYGKNANDSTVTEKAKGKQGRWATGTAHAKRKKAAAQTRRAGSGPAELGVYACSPGITGYFYHGGRYTEPHGLSRA